MKTILVTGAAGFIGSNFVEVALAAGFKVVGYDAFTYAGHLENIEEFKSNPAFSFVHANILDTQKFESVLREYSVDLIAHFSKSWTNSGFNYLISGKCGYF